MPSYSKKAVIANINTIFNKLEEAEQTVETLHAELRALRQEFEETLPTEPDEITDDDDDD